MKKFFVIFLTVGLLYSCTQSKNTQRMITVSIEPLSYFAKQIAGDKFKIQTLVRQGNNPETYEPTAKELINLSKSDLYIKVGNIGFERAWSKKFSDNAPHTIIVDSSEGITPAYLSKHTVADPHTWMSCKNATIIARNIYKALVGIDRKDSLYFKKNLNSLIEKIENTDLRIREKLTKYKTTTFLIYHPTLTYFARDYKLKQIPIEEEGKEPSAAQLNKLIKEAKKNHIKTIFVQKEFNYRNIGILANEIGAHTEEINTLNEKWPEEMVKIAEKLK